jgi:hypothetical protein
MWIMTRKIVFKGGIETPIRKESPQHDSPLSFESDPKLEAPDRFYLPVIGAVEIRLCGADMGMTHQRLDRPQIISFIQQGCGKGMLHHVRMDPLLDQRPFYHGSDEAVN